MPEIEDTQMPFGEPPMDVARWCARDAEFQEAHRVTVGEIGDRYRVVFSYQDAELVVKPETVSGLPEFDGIIEGTCQGIELTEGTRLNLHIEGFQQN